MTRRLSTGNLGWIRKTLGSSICDYVAAGDWDSRMGEWLQSQINCVLSTLYIVLTYDCIYSAVLAWLGRLHVWRLLPPNFSWLFWVLSPSNSSLSDYISPLVHLFFIPPIYSRHPRLLQFPISRNMGYHRSISFHPSSSSSSSVAIVGSKFKSRSTSLPCRSDPLISSLEHHTLSIRSWARSTQSDEATWISDGLSLLSHLLASLLDLFSDPQAAEPLRLYCSEKLLEDLLRLADAHSCFRDGLISLNQALTETQTAVRRQDATRLAAAVRAQRRAEKELSRFATLAREVSRFGRISTSNSDAVFTISIRDSVAVAALASANIFSFVARMSGESVRDIADSVWHQWAGCSIASPVRFSTPMASPFMKAMPTRKVWWIVDLLRWRWRSKKRCEMGGEPKEAVSGEEVKGEEMERRQVLQRLQELERCIGTAENGCTEIYRALMNARVSLLNILTPNF